jgi:hypothetical protein
VVRSHEQQKKALLGPEIGFPVGIDVGAGVAAMIVGRLVVGRLVVGRLVVGRLVVGRLVVG